jgi:hypothetical protein
MAESKDDAPLMSGSDQEMEEEEEEEEMEVVKNLGDASTKVSTYTLT